MFETEDKVAVIKRFFAKWNELVDPGLPENLVLYYPGLTDVSGFGSTLSLGFIRFGPLHDSAVWWRDEVSSIAPVVVNTIHTTLVPPSAITVRNCEV